MGAKAQCSGAGRKREVYLGVPTELHGIERQSYAVEALDTFFHPPSAEELIAEGVAAIEADPDGNR